MALGFDIAHEGAIENNIIISESGRMVLGLTRYHQASCDINISCRIWVLIGVGDKSYITSKEVSFPLESRVGCDMKDGSGNAVIKLPIDD
jgi:hypothetical protein